MSVTVPDGLSELLEEFAVTVLREKPRDLFEFAATYFSELNMNRKQNAGAEGAGHANGNSAGMDMGGAEGKCEV